MADIYIPEDIWVTVLSFFETRPLFLLKGVCKLFIRLIDSNKIKKVVDVSYFLRFESNKIEDLTKLDNTYYDINNGFIVDSSFLEKYSHKIVRFNIIYFEHTLVKMILPQMTNLTCLELFSNMIIKENTISMLTNIQFLSLQYDIYITSAIFTCLTNITGLCLESNKVIKNECVARLTNIRHLSLGFNDVITDDALSCLTGITMLNLYCNEVITHQGVSGLTNIRGLDLEGNTVIRDDTVNRLTNITYINLKSNSMITTNCLTNLVDLKTIDLLSNTIVDRTSLSIFSDLVVSENIWGHLKFA